MANSVPPTHPNAKRLMVVELMDLCERVINGRMRGDDVRDLVSERNQLAANIIIELEKDDAE